MEYGKEGGKGRREAYQTNITFRVTSAPNRAFCSLESTREEMGSIEEEEEEEGAFE